MNTQMAKIKELVCCGFFRQIAVVFQKIKELIIATSLLINESSCTTDPFYVLITKSY